MNVFKVLFIILVLVMFSGQMTFVEACHPQITECSAESECGVERDDCGDPIKCGMCDIGLECVDNKCEPKHDYEGCTPGYWKNSPFCWCGDYTPTTTLGSVFEGELLVEEDSLMTALNYGGGKGLEGKARNMLRQCVAALLNACSADVNAEGTVDGIKTMVNAALDSDNRNEIEATKEDCAGWNEDNPCPINSENAREPCSSKPDEQIETIRDSISIGTAGGCGG